MPFTVAPLFPLSTLNFDDDISSLKDGQYVNALNITHISENGQTQNRIHNTLGNEIAFAIDNPVAQNKKYRISGYGVTGTVKHLLKFSDMNGGSWGSVIFTEGITLALTLSNAQSAITAHLSSITPAQTILFYNATDSSYFDLEINTVTGYDYRVECPMPINNTVRNFAKLNDRIFIATEGGVYFSDDNGETWIPDESEITKQAYSLIVLGTTIFAGTNPLVLKSIDFGQSWTKVHHAQSKVQALTTTGIYIVAGTDVGGVISSSDNGVTWIDFGTGATGNVKSMFAVNTTIYIGSDLGVLFNNVSAPTTWTTANTGLTNLDVRAILDGSNFSFAGTFGGGIFKTQLPNLPWTAANAGLTNLNILSLLEVGTTVYAGTSGSGIFKTTDNGSNWTASNTGIATEIVNKIFSSGSLLFAGTTNGIFVSSDNGATWINESASTTEDLPATIIQEAHDTSLANTMNIVGGYDLLGDLFVFSTPQKYLETLLSASVSAAANNGSGGIRLTIAGSHAITTGQKIKISEGNGTTPINGLWIVTVINATTIDLRNSVFSGSGVTFARITINTEGLGEIGLAQKNNDTNLWTYTRLIQSKDLNFRLPKQMRKIHIEKNSSRHSFYFTDAFNSLRAMYYYGNFSIDGFLKIFNTLAQYEIGTIDIETRLFISNTGATLTFTGQDNSGGSLTAGNKRYAFRFLTETNQPTEISVPSNPISVYSASQSIPSKILGDESGTLTGKVNNFILSGIIPGIFKYVELIAFEYVNITFGAVVVSRTLLGNTTTSINLQHTGNETTLPISTAELLAVAVNYDKCETFDVVDNRMAIGNITNKKRYNLSAWVQSFQYSLRQWAITSVGDVTDMKFGEYLDPANVYSHMGYMHNEMYRLGFRAKYIGGGYADVEWYADIRFDSIANDSTSSGGHRLVGLSDFHLSDNNLTETYIPYIEFTNMDFDYVLPDGKRIRDVFESVECVRVECVPEVLFAGLAIGADTIAGTTRVTERYWNDGAVGGGVTISDRVFLLHSPDNIIGRNAHTFLAGDTILNAGQPILFSKPITAFTDLTGQITFPYIELGLLDAKEVAHGGTVNYITPFTLATTPFSAISTENPQELFLGGIVLSLMADANKFTTPAEKFYRYFQYFRSKGGATKYGSKLESKYISCGAEFKITGSENRSSKLSVFGGDTFTQKWHVHSESNAGYGAYVQSRVNAQMMFNDGITGTAIPGLHSGSGTAQLTNFVTNSRFQGFQYNTGYTPRNQIQALPQFIDDPTVADTFLARIAFSPQKITESKQDAWRAFTPFSFRDFDAGYGKIIRLMTINGELCSWQPKKFLRHYFKNNVLLTNETEIILGKADVMNRDGLTISNIGCSNHFAIIKGRSKGGNDIVYWIDTLLRKAVRFGFDGTVPISQVWDMDSFFANNIRWVRGKDNPASGEGICGVWDERHKAVFWTIRGWRSDIAQWEAKGTTQQGTIIGQYSDNYIDAIQRGGDLSNFEGIPDFYLCSVTHAPAAATEPGIGASWQTVWTKISHDDTNYFNQYTIELNEAKNGFASFHTFKPKIYLQWEDRFLMPRPIWTTNKVYEHWRGTHGKWFEDDGVAQESDAFIELVFAKDVNAVKRFIANYITINAQPKRIEWRTLRHYSFIDNTDTNFIRKLDKWVASIKKDTLVGDAASASELYGDWIKIKIFFDRGVKTELMALVLKFFVLSRAYNK